MKPEEVGWGMGLIADTSWVKDAILTQKKLPGEEFWERSRAGTWVLLGDGFMLRGAHFYAQRSTQIGSVSALGRHLLSPCMCRHVGCWGPRSFCLCPSEGHGSQSGCLCRRR